MISKKDLLKETNISYGQLYRWKREGLIPDSWFIKQSASTGQETYFEREKIIERIEKILELKDKFSLDDMKSVLQKKEKNELFALQNLILNDNIDPYILKKFSKNKKELTKFEICLIYIFSVHKGILDCEDYLNYDFSQVQEEDTNIYILKYKKPFLLIGTILDIFDEEIEIVVNFHTSEILDILKISF